MCHNGSYFVGRPILGVGIDDLPVVVVGHVHHLVLEDLAQPHVVALPVGVEDVHRDVRSTHLLDDRSVGAVPHVDRTVLTGSVAHEGLGALEGVHVVLEDSHDLVLVEVGHPVEEGVEVPGRVAVEGFADGVDGHMVAHELELVLVVLEGIDHEILLVTRQWRQYPQKWCRQPESRPRKSTLAKEYSRIVLLWLRGGMRLMTWPSRFLSQCWGKQRKQAGPQLLIVMFIPGNSLSPTSWLPTTLTMGIRQPSVAVNCPYIPRKQSHVQAQAGMLSSQAMSPPMMNTSGFSVAAILVRLIAALVQPESPALIILMGLELLLGMVRYMALVQNWLLQNTLVRYCVSGLSPSIKAECTFLAALYSRPWQIQVSAVTLRKAVGSCVLSSWQKTTTLETSGWVWRLRKKAQLGSSGMVAYMWQGAPMGQESLSWKILVKQVLMPKPRMSEQQPTQSLQKQRQVLYMMRGKTTEQMTAFFSAFLDQGVSWRQRLRQFLKVERCIWKPAWSSHFFLPLLRQICRVCTAIMPSIPSTRYRTSRAEQINGMIVMQTKVPLNVKFLSQSMYFFLPSPIQRYFSRSWQSLQMMRQVRKKRKASTRRTKEPMAANH